MPNTVFVNLDENKMFNQQQPSLFRPAWGQSQPNQTNQQPNQPSQFGQPTTQFGQSTTSLVGFGQNNQSNQFNKPTLGMQSSFGGFCN